MDLKVAITRYYHEHYDLEVCRTICEHAGMAAELEAATAENYEDVVLKALEKLNEN